MSEELNPYRSTTRVTVRHSMQKKNRVVVASSTFLSQYSIESIHIMGCILPPAGLAAATGSVRPVAAAVLRSVFTARFSGRG